LSVHDAVQGFASGSAGCIHHSAKRVNFYHEIMKLGLIYSNLIEKATTQAILGRTLPVSRG
jgi:hypothetical protein